MLTLSRERKVVKIAEEIYTLPDKKIAHVCYL